MKIVSYNIQYSLGKDGTHDIRRLVDAVQDADVIALQEVTRHMTSVPDFDQPARIGELLPDYFWVYGPPVDMAASLQGRQDRQRQPASSVWQHAPGEMANIELSFDSPAAYPYL